MKKGIREGDVEQLCVDFLEILETSSLDSGNHEMLNNFRDLVEGLGLSKSEGDLLMLNQKEFWTDVSLALEKDDEKRWESIERALERHSGHEYNIPISILLFPNDEYFYEIPADLRERLSRISKS